VSGSLGLPARADAEMLFATTVTTSALLRLSLALAALLAVLSNPRSAGAQTWLVPVGAAVVRPDAGRVFCADAALPAGWGIDPDGLALRVTSSVDAIGRPVPVGVAASLAACATAAERAQVVVVGRAPAIDPASVVLDLGARTLSVRGRGLRRSRLRWRTATATATDGCADPATSGDDEVCTFDLTRAALPDGGLQLSLLPPGTPDLDGPIPLDASGRRVEEVGVALSPARVVVARVVAPGAAVDLSAGDGRVALEHPDLVASATCAEAACSIEGGALVVRDARASADAVSVQFVLRPHVYLAGDAAPAARLPLQRCPATLAAFAPWRDLVEPRVVVRVGGACARGAPLTFATESGPAPVVQAATVGDQRLFAVQLERIAADGVTLTLARSGAVIGAVRVRPGVAPVGRARLETDGLGAIDFLPTNRPARVFSPAIPGSATLVPVAVEGAYEVARRDGADFVQGVDGASGAVALHLALRDASLPAPLDQVDLGVLVEPVDRALHPASVPRPLLGASPLVELVCGDGSGHAAAVAPGVTTSLPFRARDTCALVLHAERLPASDGAQRLDTSVTVTSADGDARADASFSRHAVMVPGGAARRVAITGVTAPFDRVVVRVGHAETPGEEGGGPELQWSLVFGTERGRLYATAAIPTGLFRVADTGHTGILSLNAGALFRLALLSREGAEFPVGFEAGVMWVGIAGDSDPGTASHGQVAAVMGLGLSVPIANRARATQTSISLHVWFEYEVSRALGAASAGSPYGLVFGPSLSIGDVGTNF
jgi:hypothetical protein